MKNRAHRPFASFKKTTLLIRWSVSALFAICVVLAGCQCNQQGETTTHPDISGVYTLAAINGNKLPCTPPHKGGAPLVTSGTFTIKPDGTCTSKIFFGLPSGKTSNREVNATYTVDGKELKMQWHGAGRTVGTLEGDIFTMLNEGVTFTYRKQSP